MLQAILNTGDTMGNVLGLMAVLSAAVAVTGNGSDLPVIQYSALGLCGFMIYFLCKHITKMHADHNIERASLVEQVIKVSNLAITAVSDFTQEFKSKPCILEKEQVTERLREVRDAINVMSERINSAKIGDSNGE